jgi:hypothetical protein
MRGGVTSAALNVVTHSSMNRSVFTFRALYFFSTRRKPRPSQKRYQASGIRRQQASEVMAGAWEVGFAPAAPFGFMKCELRWLSILYNQIRNLLPYFPV